MTLAIDYEHASEFVSIILVQIKQATMTATIKRDGKKSKVICFALQGQNHGIVEILSEQTSFSKVRPGKHEFVEASRFHAERHYSALDPA